VKQSTYDVSHSSNISAADLPEEPEPTDIIVPEPFNIPVDPEESDHQSIRSDTSLSTSSSSSSAADSSTSESDLSEAESESSNNEFTINRNVIDPSGNSSDSESDEMSSGSEEEEVPLYPGSECTVDEAVYDMLNDYLKHNETQASLASHLKTFLKYLPKPNFMPQTVPHLFKYLERMDPSFSEQSHFYCSSCLLLIEDTSATVCDACNKDLVLSTFYSFDVESQIKNLLENCGLAEELDKVIEVRNLAPDEETHFIRDLTDGSEYRKLNVSGYTITLLWYIDGVKVKEHSKRELWPIQFAISELPPHLRSRYIGVCGVWYDKHKPVMNTFLSPFVKSLQNINQKGGFEWTHPKTGSKHKSLIYAPGGCADAPARTGALNLTGHLSKYCCSTCEVKSVSLPLTPEEIAYREAGNRVRRKR